MGRDQLVEPGGLGPRQQSSQRGFEVHAGRIGAFRNPVERFRTPLIERDRQVLPCHVRPRFAEDRAEQTEPCTQVLEGLGRTQNFAGSPITHRFGNGTASKLGPGLDRSGREFDPAETAASNCTNLAAVELRGLFRVQQSGAGEFRSVDVDGDRGSDDRPRSGQTHLGNSQPRAALQGGITRQARRSARGKQIFGVRSVAQARDLQRIRQCRDETKVLGGERRAGIVDGFARAFVTATGREFACDRGEASAVLNESGIFAAPQLPQQSGEIGAWSPLLGFDDGDCFCRTSGREQRSPVQEATCRPHRGGNRRDRPPRLGDVQSRVLHSSQRDQVVDRLTLRSGRQRIGQEALVSAPHRKRDDCGGEIGGRDLRRSVLGQARPIRL